MVSFKHSKSFANPFIQIQLTQLFHTTVTQQTETCLFLLSELSLKLRHPFALGILLHTLSAICFYYSVSKYMHTCLPLSHNNSFESSQKKRLNIRNTFKLTDGTVYILPTKLVHTQIKINKVN